MTCLCGLRLADSVCFAIQELKKMRAACKLGAEVREFAGTLVKVSTGLACLHSLHKVLSNRFTASWRHKSLQ